MKDAQTAIKAYASKVVALAEERDYGEAVRLFKEVADKVDSWTPDRVATEVSHVSGESAHKALVKSFAFSQCYWCEQGYMPCESCDGADARSGNGHYCEECGGYGQTICTFCGGSGFLLFEGVPNTLLHEVTHEQLKWSAAQLQRLAKRSAQLKHGGADERLSTELLDALHTTLRIDAVLDNIDPFVSTDGPDGGEHTKDAKLAQQCRGVNRKYQRAFAKAVVELCQARAERYPPESQRRSTWERRKDYYGSRFLEEEANEPPQDEPDDGPRQGEGDRE